MAKELKEITCISLYPSTRRKAKKLGLHFNLHVLPDGTLIIGEIRYEH